MQLCSLKQIITNNCLVQCSRQAMIFSTRIASESVRVNFVRDKHSVRCLLFAMSAYTYISWLKDTPYRWIKPRKTTVLRFSATNTRGFCTIRKGFIYEFPASYEHFFILFTIVFYVNYYQRVYEIVSFSATHAMYVTRKLKSMLVVKKCNNCRLRTILFVYPAQMYR